VVVVEIEGGPQVLAGPALLSEGKPVEVSSVWAGRDQTDLKPSHITDGNPGTIWAAEELAREAAVTVDLQAEATVTQIRLSDAPYGRTQEFSVEAQVNGEWKEVAKGTVIGADLVLDIPPVRAQKFRLNIRKASDTPVVAEFQIFGK
jgi:alpha-L-fucosidase